MSNWPLIPNFAATGESFEFTDFANLPQKRFYATTYDSVNNQWLNGLSQLNDSVVMGAPGDYTLTESGYAIDPTVNGLVYGYIADEPLLEHVGGTGAELPAGTHVHLYNNVANAAVAFGDVGEVVSHRLDARRKLREEPTTS